MALLLVAILGAGCSNYALPHHAYAPLFDHAGQVELAGSAGPNFGVGQPELVVEGHAAVSPVEAFVITGGVTGSVIPGEQTSNHMDGELAVGLYIPRERHLRAELLLGSAVGYGTGWYEGDNGGSAGLSGVYVRPFLQGTMAGIIGDFVTFGGGLRLATTWVDMEVQDSGELGDPVPSAGSKVAAHIDPFMTLRLGTEIVATELGFGASTTLLGDNVVGAPVNAWVSLGLHLRFDVIGDTSP